MEPITSVMLQTFLERLGQRCQQPATLYLLGGSALCLLGSPRSTLDIDYDVELPLVEQADLQMAVQELAAEMRLDVEWVPLAEFAPLPPQAQERHRFVGQSDRLDVYIFDLYSIALSKIARGFESDLEDVLFLLQTEMVDFEELKRYFAIVLPAAPRADVDSREFQAYFAEIEKRYKRL
jgi:hypothetical protein